MPCNCFFFVFSFLVNLTGSEWLAKVFLVLSQWALFKKCTWILPHTTSLCWSCSIKVVWNCVTKVLCTYLCKCLFSRRLQCAEKCMYLSLRLCVFYMCLFLGLPPLHPLNLTHIHPHKHQRNNVQFTWVYLSRKETSELYKQSALNVITKYMPCTPTLWTFSFTWGKTTMPWCF